MASPDPTIVLVHGAFADAWSFRALYNELLGEEVTMIAPPNPLRGLTGGDGEYLKGVIDEISGPGSARRALLRRRGNHRRRHRRQRGGSGLHLGLCSR